MICAHDLMETPVPLRYGRVEPCGHVSHFGGWTDEPHTWAVDLAERANAEWDVLMHRLGVRTRGDALEKLP